MYTNSVYHITCTCHVTHMYIHVHLLYTHTRVSAPRETNERTLFVLAASQFHSGRCGLVEKVGCIHIKIKPVCCEAILIASTAGIP